MCEDMDLRVNIVRLRNSQESRRAGTEEAETKVGDVGNGSCWGVGSLSGMWLRRILTNPDWHLLKWLQVQGTAWAGNTGSKASSEGLTWTPVVRCSWRTQDRGKHAGIHEEKKAGGGMGAGETRVSVRWQGSGWDIGAGSQLSGRNDWQRLGRPSTRLSEEPYSQARKWNWNFITWSKQELEKVRVWWLYRCLRHTSRQTEYQAYGSETVFPVLDSLCKRSTIGKITT